MIIRNYIYLVLITNKCLNKQVPNVLSGLMVPVRVSGSVTRGVSVGNCKVTFCKSSFGQTLFSFHGINMWKSLPVELKMDHHFKLSLKQFVKLFQLINWD